VLDREDGFLAGGEKTFWHWEHLSFGLAARRAASSSYWVEQNGHSIITAVAQR